MAADASTLATTPIHLAGTSATPLADFDGSPTWFVRYAAQHPGPAFLVTSFTFSSPWDSWEVHPHGHEIVVCTAGSMTLHQELPTGERRTVVLAEGQYVVNEPGTWHTADVEGTATGLFITSGEGTAHRPR